MIYRKKSKYDRQELHYYTDIRHRYITQERLYYIALMNKDVPPDQINSHYSPITCLHDEFVIFHKELLRLKELHAQNPNTELFRKEQKTVDQLLSELNSHVHIFLKKISSSFIKKESELLSPISKTRVQ